MTMTPVTVHEIATLTGTSTSTIRDAAITYDVYDEVHDEVLVNEVQLDTLFKLAQDKRH